MDMEGVGIGLGSNMGDRLNNLRTAVQLLKNAGFIVKKQSDVFETPPFGVKEQPYFLNACLLAESDMEPKKILRLLKSIELKMGRKRRMRWGPREIDLDILFMDNLIYRDDELAIPHPRLQERPFIIVPLFQICPKWKHPLLGVTVEDLYRSVNISEIVKITNL
ncbi:MAG: 2-amino-4-hydroxy-6-hydroxymethyldihydropteridine diphosphokinase [Acetomicrobium sp.]|nr:2-amino-4-hydroxy-6-hydroxymethyldihydropteridine diphosphokinase [Acetomicrobium sp.]